MDGYQFLFSVSPVLAAWVAFIFNDSIRMVRFFAVFGIGVIAVFMDFASMRKESTAMRHERDMAWSRLRDQSDSLDELSKILSSGGATNESLCTSVCMALQAYRYRCLNGTERTTEISSLADRVLLDELKSLRKQSERRPLTP